MFLMNVDLKFWKGMIIANMVEDLASNFIDVS
jgi:hypothetical protein